VLKRRWKRLKVTCSCLCEERNTKDLKTPREKILL
jgi:hypothetical protein